MGRRQMRPTQIKKRPGRTEKISVSLDRADAVTIRQRARRLHGGNLSAALAEGVRRLREEEGREALVNWLGAASRTTPEERDAVRDSWRPVGARKGRRSRVA
jgi:hypothetical protein